MPLTGTAALLSWGKQMARLPLEPTLARVLMAAAQLGCLPSALSVAALLSAESLLLGSRGPEQLAKGGGEGSRESEKGAPRLSQEGRSDLLKFMRDGLGDHIFFLRLYEAWEEAGCSGEWCRERGADLRGLRFARDVRRQLEGIVGREGSSLLPDGATKARRHSSPPSKRRRFSSREGDINALRQALLIGFANRLAFRMQRNNGYKTLGQRPVLSQLHPSTSRIKADEDGLLPEWLIYNELIATQRPFLSKVCVMEEEWVKMVLPKLEGIDINRLSGGATTQVAIAAAVAAAQADTDAAGVAGTTPPPSKAAADLEKIAAARARFLARQASKPVKLVKR
eukprot:jgi/Botrbrau1/265/Bobra.0022s0234.1